MFKIITDTPVALTSPDHIEPWGTARDNNSNLDYIQEIENLFKKPVKVMDLGCSGGQLIKDFLDSGNIAIGLEGSDYSVKNQRVNWPELHNKNLFTCDISKPFQVLYNDQPYKCNCISAWEVIEHLTKEGLDIMFKNIINHLEDNGFFVGTISVKPEIINGVILHQTVMPESEWKEFLKEYFIVEDYHLKHRVRNDDGSFLVKLTKKK